jgi:hypothetical protein
LEPEKAQFKFLSGTSLAGHPGQEVCPRGYTLPSLGSHRFIFIKYLVLVRGRPSTSDVCRKLWRLEGTGVPRKIPRKNRKLPQPEGRQFCQVNPMQAWHRDVSFGPPSF